MGLLLTGLISQRTGYWKIMAKEGNGTSSYPHCYQMQSSIHHLTLSVQFIFLMQLIRNNLWQYSSFITSLELRE